MTDLDPMLREAMTRVHGPVNTRPSLTDVRRRARRRNRRRMTATVGVVACAGVATTALIIRRDATGTKSVASPADSTVAGELPSTSNTPDGGAPTTWSIPGGSTVTVSAGMVWDALRIAATDPSGAALALGSVDDIVTREMPTAAQFGCTTPECGALFTYVVWHEIAHLIGYGDVIELQAANPSIDFSAAPVDGAVLHTPYSAQVVPPDANGNETPTTISLFEGIILIDGGAPAGAMDDLYQRLPGYNRTIVPGTGKQIEQTEVMPIGNNADMASSVASLLGVGRLDTYDNSFLGTPIQGMVAVIAGPDYWDLTQGIPMSVDVTATTSTSSTIAATTSSP